MHPVPAIVLTMDMRAATAEAAATPIETHENQGLTFLSIFASLEHTDDQPPPLGSLTSRRIAAFESQLDTSEGASEVAHPAETFMGFAHQLAARPPPATSARNRLCHSSSGTAC